MQQILSTHHVSGTESYSVNKTKNVKSTLPWSKSMGIWTYILMGEYINKEA